MKRLRNATYKFRIPINVKPQNQSERDIDPGSIITFFFCLRLEQSPTYPVPIGRRAGEQKEHKNKFITCFGNPSSSRMNI